MAGLTERLESFGSMGAHSFGVMDVEMLHRAASHASEVVPHLRSQLSLGYVEGFTTVRMGIRNPDPKGINAFLRSCFPTPIVHLNPGFLTHVRVGKSRPSFLRVSIPCQLVSCGEPLIRREGFVALTNRGHPSCASMDAPGFGRDEPTFPATLVLAAKPGQIAVPWVPRDFLNIRE